MDKEEWAIYDDNEKLWWSNEFGWVGIDSATRYDKPYGGYLPGTSSKWIRLKDI